MNRTFSLFGSSGVVIYGLLVAPAPARAADPTTAECLNANNSAIDLRNDHKLRAARSQLLVCAASSCPVDIRKECSRRVDEINAAIPTVVFEAKDITGKDLSAVKVTMDGQPFAERLDGSALPVDPGDHSFTFEADGQTPVSKSWVIREAQKDRHESVTFGGTPPERLLEASPPGLGTQKILALVAGGIGVVGVGLGSVFGAMAISKKNDAQNACPNATCPTPDGSSKWSDAGSAGNVSTIGFIVGGVAVAGAAVLWFTAPSGGGGSASTQVGFGPCGLQVKGTW